MILSIKTDFGDALGAAMYYGFTFIIGFAIIMGVSLIIGIVLSVLKSKKK